QGDAGVRQGSKPAYDPGISCGALSGYLPLQTGEGKRLVRRRYRSSNRRRHADRAAELSASRPYGNLQFGRRLLQEILFPAVEDRVHCRRDDYLTGNDEAPFARGPGILSIRAQPRRSVSTPVHAGGLSWLDACRGGPIKIGGNSTAAASVVTSDSASNSPMLDVPGWLESHRLPKAVAGVMALKMTARVGGDARRLVSPCRQASTHKILQ